MNRSRFVALGDVGDGAAGNVLFYPSICLLHDVLHTGTYTLAGNGVMVQGGQGDDAPALLSLGGGGRGLMLAHKGHSRPRMNRLKAQVLRLPLSPLYSPLPKDVTLLAAYSSLALFPWVI